MRAPLPSLNALRAFEVAARHGSFTRAAEELHVTHSAVSHLIRGLEEQLGVRLFRRTGRRMEPTEPGRRLLPVLTDAFGRIADGVESVRKAETSGLLTVSAEPSFAARWLVLRLGRFRKSQPGIDLHLVPTDDLADFENGEADLAIRYGRGGWRGVRADLLFNSPFFAVCAPAIAAELRTPDDLARQTLLHEDTDEGWREWLAAAGATKVDPRRGPRFATAHLALAAAAAGQGVALADDALAGADLAEGRLAKPFDLEVATNAGYWLVAPNGTAERPKLRAFRDWLVAEAATSTAAATSAGP
ncbi:MAG: transcriptional regulator GcvA [Geminicoccaceae bacterium]